MGSCLKCHEELKEPYIEEIETPNRKFIICSDCAIYIEDKLEQLFEKFALK